MSVADRPSLVSFVVRLAFPKTDFRGVTYASKSISWSHNEHNSASSSSCCGGGESVN